MFLFTWVVCYSLSTQRSHWPVVAVLAGPIYPAVAYGSEHFVLIRTTCKCYSGIKYMRFLALDYACVNIVKSEIIFMLHTLNM